MGNSGYLLPNSATNRERFEWLATLIRKYRGDASVIEVQSIDNLSAAQLKGRFAEARARDYEALIRELRQLGVAARAKRSPARLGRLRLRLQEITAIDFFHSPLRARAEELLDRAQSDQSPAPAAAADGDISRKHFQGKLWVTRPRPGVDRVTSAWLIRRFIDPRARFVFALSERVPRRGVPFDMYHGGFGHRGEDCTFETLLKVFRIQDRKVAVLAQMVHDADLDDRKYGRNEGFGIDEVLKGWDRMGLPDRDILERGIQMAQGLYSSLP